MSVASRNPFSLLAEEETPPSAPANTKPTAASAAPASKPQQKKTGPASRGGGYYRRGGAPKPPATKDEEAVAEETGRFDRAENRPDRGRGGRGGRGRGSGRGRGGAGGGESRGRQYDRHSQTGLTDSDKKITNSWGGTTNELAHEDLGRADAVADAAATPAEGDAAAWGAPDASAAEWAVPAGEEASGQATEAAPAQERRPPRQEEEEDNTLTLDEYLAKKANDGLAALVPKLDAGRSTNDGNTELWKDAIRLSKEEDEETYFAGKTKAPPKPRTKKEEKVHIEIDARFPPPVRGGGRGGRGGDRGDRGGRGGDRGNGGGRGARREGGDRRGGGPGASRRDVDLDDQAAFPSLA